MKNKMKGTFILNRACAFILVLFLTVLLFPALKSEAATDSALEAYKAEVVKMILTNDKTTHDVTKYGVKVAEAQAIFNDIKKADSTKWLVASYYYNFGLSYSYDGSYIKTVKLFSADSKALARYSKLKSNVSKIKAGIEPKMTKLDKIIYIHDSLDELATYKDVNLESYSAAGILGTGKGVCSGYADALIRLLEDQNITAKHVISYTVNHEWCAVYLDGEWYHIDPTWDDTRSAKKGLTSHKFLLRNDKEFNADKTNDHGTWYVYKEESTFSSTSTRFADWYIHDIVGKMAFEDGYWYYVDTKTNCIMENTAEGGKERVILNGKGKATITLVDATSEGITYTQSGTTKTVAYNTGSREIKTDDEPVVIVDTKTEATVYLNTETVTAYQKAGTAVLKDDTVSRNSEVVTENIVSVSDLSDYVSNSEYVKWTTISKSSSGKMSLKGTVYELEVQPDPGDDDTTFSEDEPKITKTDISATFYVKREGESAYQSIGTGYLFKDETGTSKEMLAENIAVVPDTSLILKSGEQIVWTKISKSSSGKISVKGDIVK